MTELSWPIEKIEPNADTGDRWWKVWLATYEQPLHFNTDELAAAGIPAEPYPPEPVTITVTVGDRSENVRLDDDHVESLCSAEDPYRYSIPALRVAAEVGAALRRLGVQP